MITVEEIEGAVRDLAPKQLTEFRAWFAEFDAVVWDQQIEADARSGKLDSLAQQALKDFEEGRCTDL